MDKKFCILLSSSFILHFLNLQKRDSCFSEKSKQSWPRRIRLPSVVCFIDSPSILELSIFFFDHFGIRCFGIILGQGSDGSRLESLQSCDEKRSTPMTCFFKKPSRCIRWRKLPCFLEEDITFIHSERHLHDSEASFFFTTQECMLDWRSSAIFWEEGSVDVQKSHWWDIEEYLRKDFSIRDDETDIGLEFSDFFEKFFISCFFWLKQW